VLQLLLSKLVIILIPIIFLGCDSAQERNLKAGLRYQAAGDYREALAEFDNTMKRAPEKPAAIRAARESAKILVFELKNYEKAINVLKFLILYSTDAEERWRSQSQIAQIYFDNLGRYEKALIEYEKLLSNQISRQEKTRIRLAIARCYYYLGQFSLSWNEANLILQESDLSPEIDFDTQYLQANIQLTEKKYSEAAKALEVLNKKFPERAKKENVAINLSLCYEEIGNHIDAVRVLEEIKPFYEPKEYIELRIKKIRDTFSDLPRKKPKE
jgi:thioredoxin-like negative regulator of GroEL